MADLDSKWNQNIDKIAYGAAIVLGFIVLCIPLLFGGAADVNGLESALTDLERAVNQQTLTDYEARDIKSKAVEQWTPGPALSGDPAWRAERAPVLIVETAKVQDQPCVHEAGEIVELRCERDPAKKKAIIVIRGRPSAQNANVLLRKLDLQRKAEGGEDFQPVEGFKATGEFEFQDSTVKAGGVYTYRLVTVAERDPKAPKQYVFDAAKDGTRTSAEVAASGPVPHEFSFVPTSFDSQDPNIPKLFARLTYWDYKKNDAVDASPKQYSEKDTFADARFVIQTVDPVALKVTIREPDGDPIGNKWDFTPKSTLLPVKPFPAVIPGAPAPEPEAAPEPKAAPKAGKDTKAGPKDTKAGAPKTKAPEKKGTEKKSTEKKGTEKGSEKKKKGFTN